MFDWEVAEATLLSCSEAALRDFLTTSHAADLCAIGYVFELGNASEQFDLCANTQAFLRKTLEQCRAQWAQMPAYVLRDCDLTEDSVRWNSGSFECPAGLHIESYSHVWKPWTKISIELHRMANDEASTKYVYDGLIAISCKAIANIAISGMLGDWRNIDFNVCEVGDDIGTVKKRDLEIRDLIRSGTDASL